MTDDRRGQGAPQRGQRPDPRDQSEPQTNQPPPRREPEPPPRREDTRRQEPRRQEPLREEPRGEQRRPQDQDRRQPADNSRDVDSYVDQANRQVAGRRPKFKILDTENLDPSDLDALENAAEAPIDLTQEYWTPENIGESRRMVFTGIHDREIIDEETGEIERQLPCAFFLYKRDGEVQTVCNGSKRLVGAFENGKIKKGSPVSITYLGRKKNKTNQYQSDQWSVKPLLIELS